MRPDTMLAGAFDPLRRLDRSRLAPRLEGALAEFGEVRVYDEGALVAAAADPDGGQADPSAGSAGEGPLLSLVDGYFEGGPGPGSLGELRIAFQAEGEAVLPRMRGAFGLLVWDRARQAGLFARDQLGLRPAFVHEDGPVLYFATEVKPLLALLPRRPAPNPAAVAGFLAPSDLREDPLLYEGIQRIAGGEVAVFEGERWSRRRYWRPTYEPPLEGTPDEIGELTRQQLDAAVRRSIGATAQVGVLLSGGLDSTSVAASAAPQLAERGARLHGYSSVFPTHPTMDESARIEAVVDRLGLVSRRIEVRGGSALGASLEFLDAFALPDWSPNGFFMRPLARRAVDDGTELMLTGEGGDNIFSTPMYLIADRVSRGRLPSALSLIERVPHIAQHPWRSLRLRLLRDFGIEPLLPRPLHTRIAARREPPPAHLNATARRLLAEGLSARRWQALGGPRWWAEKADHFARRLTLVGAGELFTRAERLEGVHQRHPLLSLELVEFALRLPPEQQFDPHVTRPGQRRALRGRLPDEVLDASKVTFDALRAQSIQSDYEAVKWLLLSPDARIRAYTDADAVARLMDRSPGRWGDLSVWSDALMRMMVIESWLRYQEDSAFPRELAERRSLTQAALVER